MQKKTCLPINFDGIFDILSHPQSQKKKGNAIYMHTLHIQYKQYAKCAKKMDKADGLFVVCIGFCMHISIFPCMNILYCHNYIDISYMHAYIYALY